MQKLYKELLPALESKKLSLHNEGFKLVTTEIIFEYLSKNWDKAYELSEMVDEIMNVDGVKLSKYMNVDDIYRRSMYEEK